MALNEKLNEAAGACVDFSIAADSGGARSRGHYGLVFGVLDERMKCQAILISREALTPEIGKTSGCVASWEDGSHAKEAGR